MNEIVSIEEEIYTHEYLWRSSTDLLRRAENESENYKLLIPALLMTFLAYEAFINFLGHILLPDIWEAEREYFKGKGLEGKVYEITKALPGYNWSKGSCPYQTVKNLESYRDMVAHGKVIANEYVAQQKSDGTHFRYEHNWDEYLSIQSINKYRSAVIEFSQSLLISARHVSDHLHLTYDAYNGSLAHGSGNGS